MSGAPSGAGVAPGKSGSKETLDVVGWESCPRAGRPGTPFAVEAPGNGGSAEATALACVEPDKTGSEGMAAEEADPLGKEGREAVAGTPADNGGSEGNGDCPVGAKPGSDGIDAATEDGPPDGP